jgi:hypothetical protein
MLPGLTAGHVRWFIKLYASSEQRAHGSKVGRHLLNYKSSHANTFLDKMEQPEQALINDKTNLVFMTLTKVEGQLFLNQTGRFLLPSTMVTTTLSMFTQPMQSTPSPILSSLYIKTNPLKGYHDVYHGL